MLRIIGSEAAGNLLKEGKILLYPTEGVWGLGCDPWNMAAVERLCLIKGRERNKGLILITPRWEVVSSLIDLDLAVILPHLSKSPTTTWLLPATKQVPDWIKGKHEKVALRWCQHPVIRKLQTYWDKPLVSTSANLANTPSITDFNKLDPQILSQVDGCLFGKVGGLGKASVIWDFIEDKLVRA